MNSLIFKVIARLLVPVMFLFSLFLTFRGHNDAGGGFVGGLVCASSLIIYALAFSPQQVMNMLPIPPDKIMGLGLALSLSSTLFAPLLKKPVMTSVWFDKIGLSGFGTPGLFDIGVFLVVVGMSLKILLTLLEETET